MALNLIYLFISEFHGSPFNSTGERNPGEHQEGLWKINRKLKLLTVSN